MKSNRKIWRVLALVFWILIGSGLLVSFVAAVNVKTNKHCKGFLIEISGAEDFMFLDKEQLVKIITKNGADALRGKPLASINLRQLETSIAGNVWVRNAELFFDNNLLLHINVIEKEPVARIFTESGSSFYVDTSGSRLPLSANVSVKLPVFTGFPETFGAWNKQDSLLLRDVTAMSNHILHNEFWMAQTAQVNCEADGTFEIIPMLGNHRVIFGDGKNYENKFKRLFIFYKEVLGRAGIDRYSIINVAYNNQVVATRSSAKPLIETTNINLPDSIRADTQTADRSSLQH